MDQISEAVRSREKGFRNSQPPPYLCPGFTVSMCDTKCLAVSGKLRRVPLVLLAFKVFS